MKPALGLVLLSVTLQPSLATDDAEGERILLVAAPQASKFTGWARNWCHGHGGRPEHSLTFDCEGGELSFGGEIYRVRLSGIRVILGKLPSGITHIALPGHALKIPWYNESPLLLVLERSPSDLAADTGLSYIARDYGWLDANVVCLDSPLGEELGLATAVAALPGDYQNCYTLGTVFGLRKRPR
jgi:hypothetical protein